MKRPEEVNKELESLRFDVNLSYVKETKTEEYIQKLERQLSTMKGEVFWSQYLH